MAKKPARKPKAPAPKKQVAVKSGDVSTPQVATGRTGLTKEIAVADPRFGFGYSGFYTQLRYNPDDLIQRHGLKIYNRVRQDEQVKAALWIKKLATIASGIEIVIEDKERADDKVLDEQKRFIEFNLNEMEGTIESYLLDALTALDYGFSLTEPCYKTIDYGEFKGKWGWKALKVRRPEQIEFETDQFGNLTDNGILQGNKNLPANRFAIYTYRKEFGNFYGTSDLREAYRPWFVKDTLIKFMAMCMERFGQPIPVAKLQQTLSEEDKTALLQIMQNIQSRTGLIIPATIDLTFESPGVGAHQAYPPIFSLLDAWIATGILVPQLLGMSSSKQETGSNARSQTEFDTFLWVVEQLRKDLQEFINDRIIKVLIDLNYEVSDGIYPKAKFNELTHERKMEILDRFEKALTGQAITKTAEDEEFYRDLAEFPELPDGEISAGTREAKEQEMDDEVAVAGKMAKFAPKPGGPKRFDHLDYHLPGEHDQETHGNRSGGLAEDAIERGGFTYNPVRLKNRAAPRRGYALSIRKDTEKAFDATIAREQLKGQIKEYVKKHRDLIKAKGNYLGGWYDTQTKKIYIDISQVIRDKKEAVAAAKRAKQLAIYDLGNKETLPIAA